jgi:hypothetical protein
MAGKSASKIGSITNFAAIWITRSRTVAIPRAKAKSGRCFPSAFGIHRRFTGEGRYRPAFRSVCIPSRNCVTPRSSMNRSVISSTPAAPLLLRTRFHPSHRTSLLWIRSYSAWKRRVLLRLAHIHSRIWSCRTLSMGVLAVSGMPSHLPPHSGSIKAGPLPSGAFCCTPSSVLRTPRTPSRLRPTSAIRPYKRGLCPTRLPGRVSPVPLCSFPTCRRLRPRRGPALHPVLRNAVCCLRRDMTGSALSNTFRLII